MSDTAREVSAGPVLSVERLRPHTNHGRCAQDGRCRLRSLLDASERRITTTTAAIELCRAALCPELTEIPVTPELTALYAHGDVCDVCQPDEWCAEGHRLSAAERTVRLRLLGSPSPATERQARSVAP